MLTSAYKVGEWGEKRLKNAYIILEHGLFILNLKEHFHSCSISNDRIRKTVSNWAL